MVARASAAGHAHDDDALSTVIERLGCWALICSKWQGFLRWLTLVDAHVHIPILTIESHSRGIFRPQLAGFRRLCPVFCIRFVLLLAGHLRVALPLLVLAAHVLHQRERGHARGWRGCSWLRRRCYWLCRRCCMRWHGRRG